MINPNALRHPRTQWTIEAALWRAVDKGVATACNAAGGEIVTVVHNPSHTPAFSFYRDYSDVSEQFRSAPRAL